MKNSAHEMPSISESVAFDRTMPGEGDARKDTREKLSRNLDVLKVAFEKIGQSFSVRREDALGAMNPLHDASIAKAMVAVTAMGALLPACDTSDIATWGCGGLVSIALVVALFSKIFNVTRVPAGTIRSYTSVLGGWKNFQGPGLSWRVPYYHSVVVWDGSKPERDQLVESDTVRTAPESGNFEVQDNINQIPATVTWSFNYRLRPNGVRDAYTKIALNPSGQKQWVEMVKDETQRIILALISTQYQGQNIEQLNSSLHDINDVLNQRDTRTGLLVHPDLAHLEADFGFSIELRVAPFKNGTVVQAALDNARKAMIDVGTKASEAQAAVAVAQGEASVAALKAQAAQQAAMVGGELAGLATLLGASNPALTEAVRWNGIGKAAQQLGNLGGLVNVHVTVPSAGSSAPGTGFDNEKTNPTIPAVSGGTGTSGHNP